MLKAACLIARKDLRLVLSRGAGLVQALLLGLLLIFVFSLSRETGETMSGQGGHDLLAVFGVLSGLIL